MQILMREFPLLTFHKIMNENWKREMCSILPTLEMKLIYVFMFSYLIYKKVCFYIFHIVQIAML